MSRNNGISFEKNKEIKAILYDLDGTLLNINMNLFVPYYLENLGQEIAHIMDPKKFIEKMLNASFAMMAHNDDKINLEVFWDAFIPMIGHPREIIEPLVMNFYKEKFPTLTKFVKKNPKAKQVIQKTFDLGLDVVIATVPVFPKAAIEARLKWADISNFSFRLVTHAENSSTCKPNLNYYEQIFEKIGHSAEACLMVGDEDMDMVAAKLGCPTFLIPSPRTKLKSSTPKPTYRGTLDDFFKKLSSIKI